MFKLFIIGVSMSDSRIVWSDEHGDLRKKDKQDSNQAVNEAEIQLKLRRLTSGKGRTIIEITGLPGNKKWCQKLAKDLKKSLGVGGAYKQDYIEVHGDKMKEVMALLESKSLSFKKTGG
jgi:translation initiation factor 1